MADNTQLSAPVGTGDVIGTDDVSGVKYQVAKIGFGLDGAVTRVSAGNPLPVVDTTVATLLGGAGSISVNNFPSGFLAAQSGTWNVGITNASLAVTGTFWQATQPVSAASLPLPTGASTESTLSTLNGKVTACNTGAVTISGALPAGTAVIGHVILDSGTITTVSTLTQWNAGHGTAAAALRVELPTDGTGVVGLNAGSNLIGNVGIDQTTPGTTNAVQDIAGTSGGVASNSFLSTAAVQATAVKASPGQVYSIEFFNTGATPVFVRLYNQTTTPASTDGANIIWRGTVPGNAAGAGVVKAWPQGLVFSTGIGMRCTNLVADNDNTSLAANAVMGNVCYK